MGLLSFLVSSHAWAHATGLSYLEVELTGGEAKVALDLPAPDLVQALDLDVNRNGMLDSSDVTARQSSLTEFLGRSVRLFGDGRPCSAEPAASELRDSSVLMVRADFRCPAPPKNLDVSADFTEAIGDGYSTFLQFRSGTYTKQVILDAKNPSFSFDLQASGSSRWSNIARYVGMGIEHIFTGYDHILFLLALLMLGGSFSRIVGVATAFTAAHTLTLSLAALGKLTLPSRFVESAIAASIAYVAVENFWHAAPMPLGQREPIVLRWRWAITFLFGLVHGFGFASALQELGLSRQELPLALGCFNVGVEAGQVVIIMAAYPLLSWAGRRAWYRPQGVRYASVGVLGIALYWFMVRAFSG